jgi:hypothetical protein
MIISESELTAAGIGAGDIQSLSLFVSNIVNGGELLHPLIRIKETNETSLSNLHEDGFTSVYDLNKDVLGSNELQVGENKFFFYQPFNWNGTDNLIVEFSFDQSVPSSNELEFQTEDITAGKAMN